VLRGEVLHIDHFGNVITSIGRLAWTGADTLRFEPQFGRDRSVASALDAVRCRVTVGTYTIEGINRTYGAVEPGTLTALIGSAGQLEIGVNEGSAAHYLNVSTGDPVTVTI
jgi:S-adenosylmethionine hydrolase